MKLMLNDLRCAFADQLYAAGLFPGAKEGDTPAFGLTMIVPQDHSAVGKLDEAYLKMATADKKWGNGDADKAAKQIETCMKDRKKSAWQKAEYGNDDGDVYDGFEGNFYLRARNEEYPLILNPARQVTTKGKTGAPYGGCQVNVQVELFLQSNSFGKGLRCRLLGVQFVRDGDAFTAGSKADINAFETLAVSEDEDDNEFA